MGRWSVREYAPGVELRLSTRRRRSVAARREGDRIIVMAPADMGEAELREAVDGVVATVRRRTTVGDIDLEARARFLNDTYLESRATVGSVRWVSTMTTRWGSCSTRDNSIRLSDRLRAAPQYVVDQVLIHELVHTWIPDHGAEFRRWASRAPRYERAQGYLEALSHGHGGAPGSAPAGAAADLPPVARK
ncbi:M48 family metallopeptidase [Corynebacterium bovis]|uniref:M48 metallopeptidase family protein n=1 Tax=Corynebacterium bovis TaxID=36808 RepID=UPI003138A1F1